MSNQCNAAPSGTALAAVHVLSGNLRIIVAPPPNGAAAEEEGVMVAESILELVVELRYYLAARTTPPAGTRARTRCSSPWSTTSARWTWTGTGCLCAGTRSSRSGRPR